MQMNDAELKKILITENYVALGDVKAAEQIAKTNHRSLVAVLLEKGLLSKDLLGQAIAEWHKVPYADLNTIQPAKELILRFPVSVAQKYRTVLVEKDSRGVVVATDDPRQGELASALKQVFPRGTVTIAYSLPEDIDAQLAQYRKPLETRFSAIIQEESRVAPEIIGQIFSDAVALHASDIHFEPQQDEVLIRFRIDGVLQEAGRIGREHYENILNRIKVQSRMRIDEHFSAQDGSMRFEEDGLIIDIRTSIVPTVEGEKIVLRVLSAYVEGLSLDELGLSAEHRKWLEESVRKPFGMILAAGPTGSGKTTTLYALLRLLNRPEVNITTIEDPVEYKVLGANQIQVNPAANVTFARGLRSIVRQDPDIILVGEIRDEETAAIAVNAALTGHLLLSTFHANDAATVIPRLIDMHIEPFLIASTLEAVVAQRLVRRICESCRYSAGELSQSALLPENDFKRFFGEGPLTEYRGKGCPACRETGYRGRVALYEIIKMTPELQELIAQSPGAKEIAELARKQGSLSLFEDGVEKVKSGLTTMEELIRVAPAPQLKN